MSLLVTGEVPLMQGKPMERSGLNYNLCLKPEVRKIQTANKSIGNPFKKYSGDQPSPFVKLPEGGHIDFHRIVAAINAM